VLNASSRIPRPSW